MLLLELDAHPKASQGQLKSWYQQYHKAPEFTQWLVEATVSESYAQQRNGSWLIKCHLEKKKDLVPEQWQSIAARCATFAQWEVILHICQSLALNPTLNEDGSANFHPFLVKHSSHPKPFVRAWAITGLHELAKNYPKLRDDAMQLVQTAVNDPAKSVQARLRHLR